MEVQLINEELLGDLHQKVSVAERKRVAFDLRTSPDDNSQRMLNSLQPGTKVAIHRHEGSDETNICLKGRLDVVFYAEFSRLASSNERPEVERPNVDAGGPVHDGEVAADEKGFAEVARFRICPLEQKYGIQIPLGVWHSIEVYEPSTIFEAKDGAYIGK